MKVLRTFFLLSLLAPLFAIAQQDTVVSGPGVIHVRKEQIAPYVKVEYVLNLAHVRQVEVLVPVGKNMPPERTTIPQFDSTLFPYSLHRVYPQKTTALSRYYSTNIDFNYAPSDTPRADTMYVDLWIDKNGKIRYAAPDTFHTGKMPHELMLQVASISQSLYGQEWGKGGGYSTPKKFMQPSEFTPESYHCELRVIVSSYPMTVEQKRTGAKFAPFDFPLNSPPLDGQQEQFMEMNSKH